MEGKARINWYTVVGAVLIIGGLLLAAYPFSPLLLYEIKSQFSKNGTSYQDPYQNAETLGADEALTPNQLPDEPAPEPTTSNPQPQGPYNRLVIAKIGVDMPLVEGNEYALERGAWHLPRTANPDQVGNMIISGHRYKYRPPSSKTFYLLDKMAIGDTFTIYWNGGEYHYRIDKREIRAGNDFEMLRDTFDRRVTLITCDPLFSTKNRLIVSGQLLRI